MLNGAASQGIQSGRALPRWLIAVAAVAGVVVVCELLGWPFLVRPLESQMTKMMGREVSFGGRHAAASATPSGAASDAPVDAARTNTKIHLLGRVRLDADSLYVAAPEWSKDPHFIDARGLSLSIPYAAIWQARRGEAMHIVRLHADHLSVFAERMADGRSSWQFADAQPKPEPDAKKTPLPKFDSLIVREGEVIYRDEPMKLSLDASIRTAEGSKVVPASGAAQGSAAASGMAPPAGTERGLLVTTRGRYREGTFTGRLSASGALPLLGGEKEPVPLQLAFRTKGTALGFQGEATDILSMAGISGKFQFSGPSLDEIGQVLDVTLPTTGAFRLDGRLKQTTDVWNVVVDDAAIGSSRLQAQMQYDRRGERPKLQGRLAGQKLLLKDLAPSIGVEPAEPAAPKVDANGRVLPEKEFDLPSLRAMDANVLIDVDNFELGRIFAEPLTPLKGELSLNNGVLAIKRLDATTAGGRLRGDLGLDGTGNVALWTADVRWTDVEMSRWLKQQRSNNQPPYLSGKLNGRAHVKGQGRSTGAILGSLEGTIGTSLRDGTVSHLIIEGSGIDIAQALGVFFKGDDGLPVTCGVADFRAERGVLFPRAVLVDTKDSTVVVDGSVSLVDEKLDLRAVVAPKDFSPLTLRAPIRVGGTFSNPKVSLEVSSLAPKVGASALLALLAPVAAVIPLIDFGEGQKTSGCEEFLARRRAEGAGASMRGNAPAGAASAPVKVPGKIAPVTQDPEAARKSRPGARTAS